MQTFVITVSKTISQRMLEKKWAEEPSQGRPTVQFKIEGQTVTANIETGQVTHWDKQNFCQAFQLVAHKVDQECNVLNCRRRVWHVVTDAPQQVSTGFSYGEAPRLFYSETEAIREQERLNRQAGPLKYLVIPSDE